MSGSWSTGDGPFEVVELHRGRRIATVALVLVVGAALVALGLRAGRSAETGPVERDDTTELASDAPVLTIPPPAPTLEGSLVFLSEGVLSVPEVSTEVDLVAMFGAAAPPTDVLTVGAVALVWQAEGTGPIVAVDLSADELAPVSVAPAGRLLASSVPGRFWLVQSKNDTVTVTEFDAGGATVAETLVPGEPLADTGRGLVIRRDDELSVWNPFTGEVVPVGPATPFVAAAGGRVVRCPERCNLIELVGGPIPDVESVIELPGDIEPSGDEGFGVIDTDARRLAVAVRTAGRPHAAIVDLDSGVVDTFRLPVGDVQELAWAEHRLIVAAGDRTLEIDPVTATVTEVMGGPDGPVDAIAAVASGHPEPGPAVLWGAVGVEARGDAVYVSRPEELSLVPPSGDPLVTAPIDGTVTDMVATADRVWLAITRDGGHWLGAWSGEPGVPVRAPARLPAAPVDMATDGDQVVALLQDGSLWLDGVVVPASVGVAVELVAGRPWILEAGGRVVAVDAASGAITEVASFSFGAAVDTAVSGGRFWVLDDTGRVLAEQADGTFHYRSARLVDGGRTLAVDGERVVVAGGDGDVWAFHPRRPVQIAARLPLSTADGAIVDLAVVGDEVWYVTAAGQLRSEPLASP